jgi:glycopeptide antibiotics resistance protein
VSNLLLIPFSILWLLNLLSTSDLGRLITLFPVIIFLGYDLWYRTATKGKPQHHSENWLLGSYIYLLLYIIGSIMLNGYAFLVSLPHGFVVLSSSCGSLIAYAYYQYTHKKLKKRQNQQAIHNE